MYRTRKVTKAYNPNARRQHYASGDAVCPFCDLDDRPVLRDGIAMRVVDAAFPYEFWDKRNVVDHLLLLPKRHIESLSELTDAEKVESINLMAEYEAAGYSVYWRSKANRERTVPHQHTHLIKVDGAAARFSIYSAKPYVAWKI